MPVASKSMNIGAPLSVAFMLRRRGFGYSSKCSRLAMLSSSLAVPWDTPKGRCDGQYRVAGRRREQRLAQEGLGPSGQDRQDARSASAYDAVVLPGGRINPDLLRVEPKTFKFVKDIFDAKKVIVAARHTPWLLIETGIAKDRKMTSFKSLKTDLASLSLDFRSCAAIYHDRSKSKTSRFLKQNADHGILPLWQSHSAANLPLSRSRRTIPSARGERFGWLLPSPTKL
jgi:DJ-1/PfpI family